MVHYLDTNHCNDVPYIRDTLGTWQFPSQEPSCVFPKIYTWFSKCVWRDSGDVRSVGCSNMNHICRYLIQEGGNDEGHSKKRWICLIQAWQVAREHAFPKHPLWGEFLLMFKPQSWPRWSAAPDGFVWKSCAPKSTGLSLVDLVNYTMFAILIAVTGGCTDVQHFQVPHANSPRCFPRGASLVFEDPLRTTVPTATGLDNWKSALAERAWEVRGLFCIGQVMGKWELLWC